MKKIILSALLLLTALSVSVSLIACQEVKTENEPESTLPTETESVAQVPTEVVKIPIENKISEDVPDQEHKSAFGVVKAGVISEMIENIKNEGITVQDIQTVYPGIEFSKKLRINGYGELLDLSVAPRSLYTINKYYPIEYINRVNDKTIYAVYKTTGRDNEIMFVYLLFNILDARSYDIEYNTERWYLEKAFFVKNTLQYSDFSGIKVGSTISEVNAVDSLVNPNVGTDGKFTDPFNSYHLLTDGVLRIEYAFDEADGIYRVADIEYNDSFEIPMSKFSTETMSVKIDPNDYPPVK